MWFAKPTNAETGGVREPYNARKLGYRHHADFTNRSSEFIWWAFDNDTMHVWRSLLYGNNRLGFSPAASSTFVKHVETNPRTVRSSLPDFMFLREGSNRAKRCVIVEVKVDDWSKDVVARATQFFAHSIAYATDM